MLKIFLFNKIVWDDEDRIFLSIFAIGMKGFGFSIMCFKNTFELIDGSWKRKSFSMFNLFMKLPQSKYFMLH